MKKAIYFTTINGEPVKLAKVQYLPIPGAHDYNEKLYSAIPSETGRRVQKAGADSCAVGIAPNGKRYEADRVIYRPDMPSNHVCGPKCRSAKGHNCECSCGGLYHGVDC